MRVKRALEPQSAFFPLSIKEVARAVTFLSRLFHELPYSPALHNMHLRSELMQKFSQSPVCSDVSLNELPRKCASR